MLYENKNYEVIIKNGKYLVINKETNIEEFDTQLLPEALNAAYALSFRLDNFWKELNNLDDSESVITPIKSMLN
jgi:hypothetical protein